MPTRMLENPPIQTQFATSRAILHQLVDWGARTNYIIGARQQAWLETRDDNLFSISWFRKAFQMYAMLMLGQRSAGTINALKL